MSIITLLLVLAIIGVALWAITTYLPMPAPFKGIIMVIVILAVCVWLLQALGVAHGLRL